jgi:hypothetical protein
MSFCMLEKSGEFGLAFEDAVDEDEEEESAGEGWVDLVPCLPWLMVMTG